MSKKKNKEPPVKNLVVISDTHCGCQLALCPSKIRLDNGGTYHASRFQTEILTCWNYFWTQWVPQVTRGEPFAVVLNGDAMDGRHSTGKGILDTFGKYAPAMGMIGTLIGLVAMLQNMSDPSQIGTGMAVALLTTMYGAILANMVFLPLADKLSYRHEEEMLLRTVMLKGILSLQAGDNPRVTQAKLSVFLPADRRDEIEGPATRKQE